MSPVKATHTQPEETPVRPVSYSRATDVADAIATVSADPDSAFLAGGTTEVDLLRLNVVRTSWVR